MYYIHCVVNANVVHTIGISALSQTQCFRIFIRKANQEELSSNDGRGSSGDPTIIISQHGQKTICAR